MESTRQQKIARLVQKELGQIFLLYAKKMQGTLISVTHVRVSPDLSVANAQLSLFPSERAKEILEKINQDKKSIRFELGNAVRHQLRLIPDLVFHIDDSLDYLENIDRLLKLDPPSPLTEDEDTVDFEE
jgi:ribosome-binding factor A